MLVVSAAVVPLILNRRQLAPGYKIPLSPFVGLVPLNVIVIFALGDIPAFNQTLKVYSAAAAALMAAACSAYPAAAALFFSSSALVLPSGALCPSVIVNC